MDPEAILVSFVRGGKRAEDARNYNEWVKSGGFPTQLRGKPVVRLDAKKARIYTGYAQWVKPEDVR